MDVVDHFQALEKNNIPESQVSHQLCCGLTHEMELGIKYGWNAEYCCFFNVRKSFSLGYSGSRSGKSGHSGLCDITKGGPPEHCVFVHTP